jgi:hypothetical protein
MAVTATINVSGIAAIRYILVDTTTFYFTGAVDGQKLTLTLQQDTTGSRAVASGNTPGIMQPSATASSDTTQQLIYDAATNTWNGTPQQLAPGSLVLNSYTTSTTIAWARGTYAFTSTSTFNLTVTNPVAGPPGVGNDGEVMIFTNLSAKTNGVTMGTTQTINASSTSVAMAGTVGTAVALQAWGGKVYVVAASGSLSFT